jgi:dsRNA-specific ribonuclease
MSSKSNSYLERRNIKKIFEGKVIPPISVEKKDALKLYIISLLERANLKKERINRIVSRGNMELFVTAFTHSSYDPFNNYEFFEFIGDTIINQFVSSYIISRFPNLRDVGVLTRIKHTLVSNKILADILYKENLHLYIRYGSWMLTSLGEEPNTAINKDWKDMLGDVMEAFCGCLKTIICEKLGHMEGLAIQIIHSILKSFFDTIPISAKHDDIYDAVSRLKEMYESKTVEYRWPFKHAFVFREDKQNNRIYCEVKGWPSIKKGEEPTINNRTTLAVGFEPLHNRKGLKERLAKEAISVLREKYNLFKEQQTSGDKN